MDLFTVFECERQYSTSFSKMFMTSLNVKAKPMVMWAFTLVLTCSNLVCSKSPIKGQRHVSLLTVSPKFVEKIANIKFWWSTPSLEQNPKSQVSLIARRYFHQSLYFCLLEEAFLITLKSVIKSFNYMFMSQVCLYKPCSTQSGICHRHVHYISDACFFS